MTTRLTLGAALGAAPRSSGLIRQARRRPVPCRRDGRVVFDLDHGDLGPLRQPLGQGPTGKARTRSSRAPNKRRSKQEDLRWGLRWGLLCGAAGWSGKPVAGASPAVATGSSSRSTTRILALFTAFWARVLEDKQDQSQAKKIQDKSNKNQKK